MDTSVCPRQAALAVAQRATKRGPDTVGPAAQGLRGTAVDGFSGVGSVVEQRTLQRENQCPGRGNPGQSRLERRGGSATGTGLGATWNRESLWSRCVRVVGGNACFGRLERCT